MAGTMSPQAKARIKAKFKKNSGQDLTFTEKDKFTLIDKELFFINSIYDFSSKKAKTLLRINGILDKSKLEYKDRKIINKQGACSLINEEIIGDIKYIRKTTVSRDIQLEYELLKELKQYNNNYIIQIVDASFDGSSFLMEPASDSLENYIKHNHIAESEKVRMILWILKAVSFLHTQGILHRDLHPGNILLIKEFNKNNNLIIEKWKIADFGFACKIEKIKEYGNGIDKPSYGRPDYTAPEQFESLFNSSVKSDIYSLGKIINFIMTQKVNSCRHILNSISQNCSNRDQNQRYSSVREIIFEINNRYQQI